MPAFPPIEMGWLRLRKLTLQRPVIGTPDAFGQPPVTWTTEATVRAYVEAIGGRELWYGQAVSADTTHMVVIRDRAGGGRREMESNWRFLDEDFVPMEFTEPPRSDPSGIWTVIQCKIVDDAGWSPTHFESFLDDLFYPAASQMWVELDGSRVTRSIAQNDLIGEVQNLGTRGTSIKGQNLANRPSLDFINGKPNIKFAGSHWLRSVFGANQALPFTMGVAFRVTGAASTQGIWGGGIFGNGQIIWKHSTGKLAMSGMQSVAITGTTTLGTTAWWTGIGVFDVQGQPNSRLYVNGVLEATGNANVSDATRSGDLMGLYDGANPPTGSNPFTGNVAAAVGVTRAITDAEALKLHDWLSKWIP